MRLNKYIQACIAVVVCWSVTLCGAPVVIPVVQEGGHLDNLPEDLWFVIDFRDVPRVMESAKESPFYKAGLDLLDSDTMKALLDEEPEVGIVIDLVKATTERIPKVITGEFSFAFIDDGEGSFIPNIAFLADLDEKALNKYLSEVLNPALRKLNGPAIALQRSGPYRSISTQGSPDEGLLFKIQDGLMVASPMGESIDEVMSTSKPLSKNAAFADARRLLSTSPDILSYFNLAGCLKSFEDDFSANEKQVLKSIGISSLHSLISSVTVVDDNTLEEIIAFAPEGLSGIMGLCNIPGSGPGMEKLVPMEHDACIRISLGSFEKFFNSLTACLEEEYGEDSDVVEDFNTELEFMEEELGFSVSKDLLPLLGGSAGFSIKVPKTLGIPEAAMYVEVKEPEKLEALIKPMFPQGVKFTKTTYKDIVITSTTVDMVQPSYAFVGGYLVVAVSPAVVRDVIDAKTTGNCIMKKEDYAKAFESLPEKSIVSMYIDMASAIQTGIPLAITALEAQMGHDGGRRSQSLQMFMDYLTAVQKNCEGISGDGLVITTDERSIRLKRFSGLTPLHMAVPMSGISGGLFFMAFLVRGPVRIEDRAPHRVPERIIEIEEE